MGNSELWIRSEGYSRRAGDNPVVQWLRLHTTKEA